MTDEMNEDELDDYVMASEAFNLFTREEKHQALDAMICLTDPADTVPERFVEAVHHVIKEILKCKT